MKSVFFFCLVIIFFGVSSIVYTQGESSFIENTLSRFADGDCVVAFGDSITQAGDYPDGYVTIIRKTLNTTSQTAVSVVNAGISGNEVPDLQARLEQDVLSKKPTIVFIYIGINDVWHYNGDTGEPRNRFEVGLREIIHKLQQRGITAVLATPSVICEKADGTNPCDPALNTFADTSRLVAREMHVELCDLRKAFMDYLKVNNIDGKERGILTYDSVHLNAAGNQLVAHEATKSLIAARAQKTIPLVMTDIEFVSQGQMKISFLHKQKANNLVIRYTTDGRIPNVKSLRYAKPIKVINTSIITAQVFRANKPIGYPISAKATKLLSHP